VRWPGKYHLFVPPKFLAVAGLNPYRDRHESSPNESAQAHACLFPCERVAEVLVTPLAARFQVLKSAPALAALTAAAVLSVKSFRPSDLLASLAWCSGPE
jgi:hypothetical protein